MPMGQRTSNLSHGKSPYSFCGNVSMLRVNGYKSKDASTRAHSYGSYVCRNCFFIPYVDAAISHAFVTILDPQISFCLRSSGSG